MAVATGGWMPHVNDDGKVLKGRSPWFSLELTETTAPWAFVRLIR